METEVETIIAQLCGCIDTGTLSKYGKNSRVEDVKKRRGEMTLPNNINFDEVFNLEEMCNTKMGKKLKALNFTQEKIDMIWDSCRDFYEKYDVCIDPVLYLAIICQEGTGSFNTSSANRAADGQHGYEADYVTDLSKVNSLLYAKLTGYMLYGEEFKEAVNQNCDKNGITSGGTLPNIVIGRRQ